MIHWLVLSSIFLGAFLMRRVERICRESCRELSGDIVVIAEREVIRQVKKQPKWRVLQVCSHRKYYCLRLCCSFVASVQ